MAKRTASGLKKLRNRVYANELGRLQAELVVMQEWVKHTGNRIVVLCEGRDAAGKGSAIKRITEVLNPRYVRIAALPAPNDRERTQWYFQKYIAHLPSAGEIVTSEWVRYRTVGDATCTGAVRSTAVDVHDVLAETAAATISERGATRADDRTSEAAMEDRKRQGYF